MAETVGFEPTDRLITDQTISSVYTDPEPDGIEKILMESFPFADNAFSRLASIRFELTKSPSSNSFPSNPADLLELR